MKKYRIILPLIFLAVLCNAEGEQSTENEKINTAQSAHSKELLTSFSKFMERFINLFSVQNLKDGIQKVDNMMISLVKTGNQFLNKVGQNISGVIHPKNDRSLDIEMFDQETWNQLIMITQIKVNELIITRKNCPKHNNYKESDREDVKQILGSFAGVMQNFFNIVQDPENRGNIIKNLVGMFPNIAQAAKIIMKDDEVSPSSVKKEIILKRVAEIDVAIKEEILGLFQVADQ